MSASHAQLRTKTHLSLNVADLARSVEFYRVAFGIEPAKRRDDYAKFELPDPPVVLSLQPQAKGAGASLSHLGLRLPDAESVRTVQRRLEASGIETRRQDGVICGYALQSKCWASDPDRNLWEFYVLEADIDPSRVRACLSELAPSAEPNGSAPPPATSWEHHLSDPVPARLAYSDDSLDEVRLEGTWNAPLDEGERQRLLAELFRVLRPGGKLSLHGLVGDRPFAEAAPRLPGPASLIGRVPLERDAVADLGMAGFSGVHVHALSPAAYMTIGGVELREQRVAAVKPLPASAGRTRAVLYKGPLASVTDSDGTTFPRGRRVEVFDRTWEALLAGPAAGQFLFVSPNAKPACNAR